MVASFKLHQRAPGIKKKGERRNEKGENNKAGSSEGEENPKGDSEKRAPSLKEKVNMNAEALEKMSQNIVHLTNLHQSQWSGQWGGPSQWGGGYNW